MIEVMEKKRLFPVGIQTFEKLRRGGFVYIDKTDCVYQMTHSGWKNVFLNRPRRFGKSLLTSTLHSYFAGQKDLFEGLAIEKLETDWDSYPVLHFDMSLGKHMDKEGLEEYLSSRLRDKEKEYGLTEVPRHANDRLTNLIKSAYEQTGKPVVEIGRASCRERV